MSTIAAWLSKAILVVSMAVFGSSAALPAKAAVSNPPSTPTPPAQSFPGIQRAWAREQKVYGRLGTFFGNIDQRLERAQQLIDKAKANGKDVSALQSALDAFSAAVTQARPLYQGLNGIVSSHQGFDDNGNVVEPVKAFATVLDMRGKLQQIRQTLGPAGKALRQAIQDFRAANRPTATPTP